MGTGGDSMSISDKVKGILALSGRKQTELAVEYGMSRQSMGNKFARGSWSASDLARVAKFCGGELAVILPDGQKITIDPDEPKAETDS